MEYSVEQIKDMYCKFNCRVKHSRVINDKNDQYFNMCYYCQINNFIRELEDYKKINK